MYPGAPRSTRPRALLVAAFGRFVEALRDGRVGLCRSQRSLTSCGPASCRAAVSSLQHRKSEVLVGQGVCLVSFTAPKWRPTRRIRAQCSACTPVERSVPTLHDCDWKTLESWLKGGRGEHSIVLFVTSTQLQFSSIGKTAEVHEPSSKSSSSVRVALSFFCEVIYYRSIRYEEGSCERSKLAGFRLFAASLVAAANVQRPYRTTVAQLIT